MNYRPEQRGKFAVGVRTLHGVGARGVPVELWYPAADVRPVSRESDTFVVVPGLAPQTQQACRDAASAEGPFPLLIFSHGFGSHRRQSTFLCTHLASRGFVVAAPDHLGNTVADLVAWVGRPPAPVSLEAMVQRLVDDRLQDLADMLDDQLDLGAAGRERIGFLGHSFGAFSAVAAAGRSPAAHGVFAMAPAGGAEDRFSDLLRARLELSDGLAQRVLVMAGEEDSITRFHSVQRFAREVIGCELESIAEADHMHFCDSTIMMHELVRAMPMMRSFLRVADSIRPATQLLDPETGYRRIRASAAAHFDRLVRG